MAGTLDYLRWRGDLSFLPLLSCSSAINCLPPLWGDELPCH